MSNRGWIFLRLRLETRVSDRGWMFRIEARFVRQRLDFQD